MHKDPFSRLDLCAVNQCAVAGRRGYIKPRCLLKAPPFGDREQGCPRAGDQLGIRALRGTEDPVAGLEPCVRAVGGCREDGAAEFGSGDPREGRLVLVPALDLQDVEEVGRRGVDADEVLGGFGGRCGEVGGDC